MANDDANPGTSPATPAELAALAAAGNGPGPIDNAPHQVLQGRDACATALREAIELAATEGCREMWWCDADFAGWPIGEPAVVEALERWAYAHRRLTVIALDYEAITQRHPRWVQFRRRWAHVVECRAIENLEPEKMPGLLLVGDRAVVRVFDRVHHRGSASRDRADIIRSREALDALVQQSTDAFPATTLGL